MGKQQYYSLGVFALVFKNSLFLYPEFHPFLFACLMETVSVCTCVSVCACACVRPAHTSVHMRTLTWLQSCTPKLAAISQLAEGIQNICF